MSSAGNLDWLYHLLGWALAAAGVVLLVWALFWDRSRGRRRCPKCWYSMEGVPGLRCPECGREAKAEPRLLRTRHRWWRAVLGLTVIAAGYTTTIAPALMRSGWRSQIPSTALIAAVSWLDSPTLAERYARGTPLSLSKSLYVELMDNRLRARKLSPWQRRWLMSHMIQGDRQRPQYSTAWHDSFEDTLARVHEAIDMREAPKSWQHGYDCDNALDLSAVELQQLRTVLTRASIRTRAQWPEGTPVFVELDTMSLGAWRSRELCAKSNLSNADTIRTYIQGSGDPGCGSIGLFDPWKERLSCIGLAAAPQTTTIFDILLYERSDSNQRELVHDRAELPIRISGTIHDIIRPCPSPDIENHIRTTIHPAVGLSAMGELAVGLGQSWCGFRSANTLAQLCAQPIPLTLGVRITLICDGRELCSTKAWWSTRTDRISAVLGSNSTTFTRWDNVVTFPFVDAFRLNNPSTCRWEVRITGDGEVSLRDFDSDRYWQGDVVLPAAWRSDLRNAWKD